MPRLAILMFKMALAAALAYVFVRACPVGWPLEENEWFGRLDSHTVAWAVLACIMYAAAILFGVVRWRVLLSGQGFHIPFVRLVRAWLVGSFLGTVLFGQIGRDAYRLYDMTRCTKQTAEPLAVLAAERVCGLVSFILLMVITVPWVRRIVTVDPQWFVAVMGAYVALMAIALGLVLNPRLGPFLAAIVPFPDAWRASIARFAFGVAAYSSRKKSFLLGIVASLARQLAACLALSALVMAFREQNTVNALQAGPAFLFGPKLAPFLGDDGTARMLLNSLLGTAQGAATTHKAFDVATWFVTMAVPFGLGGAALFMPRPRGCTVSGSASLFGIGLSSVDLSRYRRLLADTILGGLLGGLVAGGAVGLCEAVWLERGMVNPPELQVLWWGPLAYGLMLSGCGFAVACFMALAYAVIHKVPRSMGGAFAVALGGTVTASLLIIGRWRYVRDVLYGQEVDLRENLIIFALALGTGIALERAFALAAARIRISRRVGAALALVTFGCLVIVGVIAQRPTVEQNSKIEAAVSSTGNHPNIILIVIDTLRADFLWLYSDPSDSSGRSDPSDVPIADTPNFVALAADGIVFRNAFAQAPWTKPSFATIFTSLYASEHGAVAKAAPLPEECVTLAETLAERGYYTKGFANNRNIVPTEGFAQGFTEYDYLEPHLIFGARPSSSELALYEVLRRIHARLLSSVIDVENFYVQGERVNRAVSDWLDGSKRPSESPFFLFVHYMDPHDPYMDSEQPGVGYAMIELGFHPDAALYREPMRAAYIDEIEHVDQCLGGLVAELRARGLYDDSVILVTADHGEQLHDHEGWWHGETLFDEELCVPFLVKLPHNEQAGTSRDDFAQLLDVAPTLLDLADAAIPAAMRGRPLFGEGQSTNGPATIFAERHFGDFALRSARSRDAKLITARPGEDPKYFELRSDPREHDDRFNSPSAQKDFLGEQMEEFERSMTP